LLIIGTLGAIVSGAVFPFFLLFFADITVIFREENRSVATSKGWELCWKFFIIGGATWFSRIDSFILEFLGSYCWNVVGSSQSVRLKKLYYKLLLDQEVEWFDENDPHKIVTRVATSITSI
jgi:ATP-binding cassette, subfamily B (MDR/TAP), member 1